MEILFAVPTIITSIVNNPDMSSMNLRNLQFVCSGAANIPVRTRQDFSRLLSPGNFCQMTWGMTEVTCLAMGHPPGEQGPWESVEKPFAGGTIKSCDSEGNCVSPGSTGELIISGAFNLPGVELTYRNLTYSQGQWSSVDTIMSRNQNMEPNQADGFVQGTWGKIDDDGYVYVVGRDKVKILLFDWDRFGVIAMLTISRS